MSIPVSGNYSLGHALEGFFDSVPATLVSAGQLGLLQSASAFFPPLLRFALECRLNGDQQVDLQLCIRRDEDYLPGILQWAKGAFTAATFEQESIVAFFENWAAPSSGHHSQIVEVFLELDVLSPDNRIPLLFFALEPGL